MLKSFIKKSVLYNYFLQSDIYYYCVDPKGYRSYRKELSFYKKFLAGHHAVNDLIFDVGANMGRKAYIFSKLANKVVAFEPTDKYFNYLIRRFVNKNVLIENYALGSQVSHLYLYIVDSDESYNSLNEKHIVTTVTQRGLNSSETLKSKQVKVEILENFILKYGLPKFIKIDVEGYEFEVIKGLKTPSPLLSFEVNLPEFKGESLQSISYLDNISSHKYLYNFASSNSFIKDKFVAKEVAIDFLINTKLKYLEVFAKLND
jgi:FkbM family methyltransferase